jgi:hypothetical protein
LRLFFLQVFCDGQAHRIQARHISHFRTLEAKVGHFHLTGRVRYLTRRERATSAHTSFVPVKQGISKQAQHNEPPLELESVLVFEIFYAGSCFLYGPVFVFDMSLQSFDTIRQAPSTPTTSIGCSDDHRWSDVVPPEAGLTFSVAWDPEGKDIPTFSAAQLSELGRDSRSPDSPSDAYDNRSQVLTITPSVALASEFAATPGTLQFFRENQDFLFAEAAFFPDRALRGRTQTSSTLDGLDVYLRGSMLGKAHTTNRYYSCFQELDGDFAFDPYTSFAHMWMRNRKGEMIRDDVSDEGFFEGGQFGGMDNEVNLVSFPVGRK